MLIGSVKTNVGHLEAAAGMAGLIKVVLSLGRREIPPHLHFHTPNPYLPWQELPVAVPRTLTPWRNEGMRRAGLSSFGFIGTNAHIVLEEAGPRAAAVLVPETPQILFLSARSEPALRELAQRWVRHLDSALSLSLADLAFSARQGRAVFAHRLLIAASSREEARSKLAAFVEDRLVEGVHHGENLDIEEALADPARRRVPLPSYPFQRQRYWPDGLTPLTPARPLSGEGTSIAGRRLRSALRQRIHEARWDTSRFPALADHRLFGEVVVPGAWHLAALLAALVEMDCSAWEIEEVTFSEALALEKGASCTTQLIVSPTQNDEHRFELFSQRGDAAEDAWTLHASARACRKRRADEPEFNPPLVRGFEGTETTAFYRMMGQIGIELGQSFRWLEEVHAGQGQAVARMRQALPGEAQLAPLPPGLIDSCFQLVAAALASDTSLSQTLIPLAIDRVTFLGAGSGPYWCRAVVRSDEGSRELTVADVTLVEETGRPVLIVEGLRVRRASPDTLLRGRKLTQEDWLYSLAWQPSSRPARRSRKGTWLLLSQDRRAAEDLADSLVLHDQRCDVGESVLVTGLDASLTDVVFLADSRESATEPESVALDLAVRQHCETVLELVQTLARLPKQPRLWLITSGVVALDTFSAPLCLEQAPLIGLARTIALEHPELRCSLIDLDASTEELTRELLAADNEDQIVLRGEQRFVARLTHAEPPVADTFACLSDATYAITGGLGGLGLEMARGLAHRGARHLLLIGRRPPSAEARAVIEELQSDGVSVVTAAADVAEYDELGKVLAEARASMPPLRGLIHAAGILDDGVLLEQTAERFEKVLVPKVRGGWNLHLLTREVPLDFFVLFSSAASLLGSPGQGNYAAGNAFLDALAHHRRALGLPALSINWGPWADVGMAARNGVPASRWAGLGWRPLAPARAVALLDALIPSKTIQTGVLDVDWERYASRAGVMSSLLSALIRSQPVAGPDAGTAFLEQLRDVPEGRRRERLLEHGRDTIAAVLRLTPEQAPGERTRLFEMGLDSLMALEVRARLQQSLGVALPSTLIFDHPTLASLADFLLRLLPAQAVEPQPEPVPDGIEDGLRELSEDDLERLLLAKLESLQRRTP